MRTTRNNTEQKKNANCRRKRRCLFPAKFKAATSELGLRKTHLICYKDIQLTENHHKIS